MRLAVLSAVALFGFAAPAFADCEKDFDALSKAISGPVTMESGHRAAMMRLAVHGYDMCMAGDAASLASTRDMIMKQISQSLGGK